MSDDDDVDAFQEAVEAEAEALAERIRVFVTENCQPTFLGKMSALESIISVSAYIVANLESDGIKVQNQSIVSEYFIEQFFSHLRKYRGYSDYK